MRRTRQRRTRLGTVLLLLIAALVLAPASSALATPDESQGNPPDVECGVEDVLFNKYQINDGEIGQLESNTTPEEVVDLDDSEDEDSSTFDYENLFPDDFTIFRIRIKSGQTPDITIDDPEQSGTLENVPSDVSHITFCLEETEGPTPEDEICDDQIDNDLDGLVDGDDPDCEEAPPEDGLDCPEGATEFDSDGDGEPDTCVLPLPPQENDDDDEEETAVADETKVLGEQLAKTAVSTNAIALFGAAFLLTGFAMVAASRRQRRLALPVASSAAWIAAQSAREARSLVGARRTAARARIRRVARRARAPGGRSPG